jgi:hypothetical protein
MGNFCTGNDSDKTLTMVILPPKETTGDKKSKEMPNFEKLVIIIYI